MSKWTIVVATGITLTSEAGHRICVVGLATCLALEDGVHGRTMDGSGPMIRLVPLSRTLAHQHMRGRCAHMDSQGLFSANTPSQNAFPPGSGCVSS